MLFGVVSEISQGMDVLDGGGYRRRGRDSFGVSVGHPSTGVNLYYVVLSIGYLFYDSNEQHKITEGGRSVLVLGLKSTE